MANTTTEATKELLAKVKSELYLYHCAGGHTRAANAAGFLTTIGFRFERNPGDGPSRLIYWPDGVRLTYTNGKIDYRENEGAAVLAKPEAKAPRGYGHAEKSDEDAEFEAQNAAEKWVVSYDVGGKDERVHVARKIGNLEDPLFEVGRKGNAQAESVARLAAAAPELLALVKQYREESLAQGADDSDLKELNDLIARAGGR